MVRRGPRIIAISDMGSRQGSHQQRWRYAHIGGNDNERHPRLKNRDARDNSRLSPVPREHYIDRWSDPIQGPSSHTTLTPRRCAERPTRCPPGRINDDRPRRILCILARHVGRHQRHSEKLRTLPPDGTITAWSATNSTYPGRLPLSGSVLGLLCTQGCTLPRDGGQILELADHLKVDGWRRRTHKPLTSRLRDVRDARRARIGWGTGVHLHRDQVIPAQMGRTPPLVIGGLPSQQLSRGDWS